MVCNRCHRFLMAWSVRFGSRCAIRNQRWPNSATLAAMIASSRVLQPVRSGCLARAALGEAGAALGEAGDGGGCSWPEGRGCGEADDASGGDAAPASLWAVAEETAGAGWVGEEAGLAAALAAASPRPTHPPFASGIAMSPCSRFHRLRTASSERPGINSAMRRHLSPFSFAWRRISRSSSRDHSFLVIPGVPLGASVACRFARQMCPFFGAPHRLHLYTLYLLYPGLLSSAPPPPTPPLPPPLPPPSPPISRSMATSHSHCSALIPWVAPPRSQPILSQTSTR
mmetsp:Transcript_32418/g.96677  ORF Transcript_32418/g.96677 Transcript_32418/m.96677 type:complete len:284 (-) Transcript_32418:108-959(-)